MDKDKLREGFTRNRRFLIAISVALAAISLLDLQFTQINLLGNSADIHNADRVAALEWAVWAWAVAQYIVWFRDVGAWQEFRNAIEDDTASSFGRDVERDEPPDWVKTKLLEQLMTKLGQVAPVMGVKDFASKFTTMQSYGPNADHIANVEVTAFMRLPDDTGYTMAEMIRIERVIEPVRWRARFRWSMLSVIVTRRFTLEFFAPFAIAGIPVAVLLWKRVYHL
jgi:hypothetical protein